MDPQRINGSWTDGYTLDEHTLSSELIGHNEYGHPEFDTTRSAIGEALYQLKYRNDRSQVAVLAKAAAEFVKGWHLDLDVVASVPPTRVRAYQPAVEIAKQLATALGIPYDGSTLRRTATTKELKGVLDPSERAKLLEGAFRIRGGSVKGKAVLLFDDLYRSGATMNAASSLLFDPGGAESVYALALTRTRTKR